MSSQKPTSKKPEVATPSAQRNISPAHKVDIVKYRWLWVGISLIITVPGLIAVCLCLAKFHAPLKPGIDFTGGTILQYQFDKQPDLEQVRTTLDR